MAGKSSPFLTSCKSAVFVRPMAALLRMARDAPSALNKPALPTTNCIATTPAAIGQGIKAGKQLMGLWEKAPTGSEPRCVLITRRQTGLTVYGVLQYSFLIASSPILRPRASANAWPARWAAAPARTETRDLRPAARPPAQPLPGGAVGSRAGLRRSDGAALSQTTPDWSIVSKPGGGTR